MNETWEKITDPKHTFIIAEAGVNHNGRLDYAMDLIDIAVTAKADAVKFQTFKASKLVTPYAPKAAYQLNFTPRYESQFDMLRKLELSEKDYKNLFNYCKRKKITFMSTPFDEESAYFLHSLGMEIFKIPSGEITNFPFIKYITTLHKPLIISTGMSHMQEVKAVVKLLKNDTYYALLHCVSNYPADAKDVNLRAMASLAKVFTVPVGFSDHTLGIEISLAAVAMGAKIIEKHFTLDLNLKGPDHQASLKPNELQSLIKGIRNIERALGDGKKVGSLSEQKMISIARKSLVAACDIPIGIKLSEKLIACKRPGTGLSPTIIQKVLGKKTKQPIKKDKQIQWGMLE